MVKLISTINELDRIFRPRTCCAKCAELSFSLSLRQRVDIACFALSLVTFWWRRLSKGRMTHIWRSNIRDSRAVWQDRRHLSSLTRRERNRENKVRISRSRVRLAFRNASNARWPSPSSLSVSHYTPSIRQHPSLTQSLLPCITQALFLHVRLLLM